MKILGVTLFAFGGSAAAMALVDAGFAVDAGARAITFGLPPEPVATGFAGLAMILVARRLKTLRGPSEG